MPRAQKVPAYSRAYSRALEKFSEHLKRLEHYFQFNMPQENGSIVSPFCTICL